MLEKLYPRSSINSEMLRKLKKHYKGDEEHCVDIQRLIEMIERTEWERDTAQKKLFETLTENLKLKANK